MISLLETSHLKQRWIHQARGAERAHCFIALYMQRVDGRRDCWASCRLTGAELRCSLKVLLSTTISWFFLARTRSLTGITKEKLESLSRLPAQKNNPTMFLKPAGCLSEGMAMLNQDHFALELGISRRFVLSFALIPCQTGPSRTQSRHCEVSNRASPAFKVTAKQILPRANLCHFSLTNLWHNSSL